MKVNATGVWDSFARGRDGLERSSRVLNEAAQDVASSTATVLNGRDSKSSPAVHVDMDRSLLRAKTAEHAYAANARTVRVSDETIDAVLDLVARRDGRAVDRDER